MGSESRKKTELLQIRATPEEKGVLKRRAAAFGVSFGELCRSLVFDVTPNAKTDQEAITSLAETRADLGRLGGLLKGWLGGSAFPDAPAPERKPLKELLREIEAAEREVIAAVRKLIAKV